ncbi:signal peptidase complex subunit 1-like [Tachyglossus aculeatus]|uniref:signal peptidase complex subunit 1-like n=1 Tax=Tachyglossus aculeatus TaxID=9261 RepID=UPI0018F75469|nr:signal peptidase complex subunit 1-like [Tachyglossus aculeatus]
MRMLQAVASPAGRTQRSPRAGSPVPNRPGMDFEGQKLAERLFKAIILASAAIGFVSGYVAEQFCWTLSILAVGVVGSCLLVLPAWPLYRQHPLKWLPAREPGRGNPPAR